MNWSRETFTAVDHPSADYLTALAAILHGDHPLPVASVSRHGRHRTCDLLPCKSSTLRPSELRAHLIFIFFKTPTYFFIRLSAFVPLSKSLRRLTWVQEVVRATPRPVFMSRSFIASLRPAHADTPNLCSFCFEDCSTLYHVVSLSCIVGERATPTYL